jgi:hypothetical protein
MGRKAVCISVFLLLAVSQAAFAQRNAPRVELFGGFSSLPANVLTDFPRDDSYGFQGSVVVNLNRWFGIVGDFGGQYRTVTDLGSAWPGITAETSVYEYLVGPRFAARRGRATLFVHALVGGATGNAGLAGFSDSNFALGAGGGLDIDVTRRLAIRAVQFDWMGSFVDILEDNVRLGFGVVVKLGGFGATPRQRP